MVENTHEPVVSQELWDMVQKLMESRRRETNQGEIQMFAGLVKCAGISNSALGIDFALNLKVAAAFCEYGGHLFDLCYF